MSYQVTITSALARHATPDAGHGGRVTSDESRRPTAGRRPPPEKAHPSPRERGIELRAPNAQLAEINQADPLSVPKPVAGHVVAVHEDRLRWLLVAGIFRGFERPGRNKLLDSFRVGDQAAGFRGAIDNVLQSTPWSAANVRPAAASARAACGAGRRSASCMLAPATNRVTRTPRATASSSGTVFDGSCDASTESTSASRSIRAHLRSSCRSLSRLTTRTPSFHSTAVIDELAVFQERSARPGGAPHDGQAETSS